VTGIKAELMLRVLGAFKLTGPTTAPAQLLRTLFLERYVSGCNFMWDGPDGVSRGSKLYEAMSQLSAASQAVGQIIFKGLVGTSIV
jgi:hypothetical protein